MKTMEELYREVGPQGWPDDPADKQKPNQEQIDELEEALEEIDMELEDIEAQKEELDDRETSLLNRAAIYEKRLKALRG